MLCIAYMLYFCREAVVLVIASEHLNWHSSVYIPIKKTIGCIFWWKELFHLLVPNISGPQTS